MKWYRELYVGESAKKKQYEIIWKVKHGIGMLNVYLITLPSNDKNLLDIFKASVLKQKHFRNVIFRKDIYIVGIACGYDEAVELSADIVNDIYNKTKTFKVKDYLTANW